MKDGWHGEERTGIKELSIGGTHEGKGGTNDGISGIPRGGVGMGIVGLPTCIISPFNFGVKPGTIEGTDEFGACLGGVETV